MYTKKNVIHLKFSNLLFLVSCLTCIFNYHAKCYRFPWDSINRDLWAVSCQEACSLAMICFFFFFCFFGEHQGIFCNTIREPGTSWVNEQGGSLLVVLILRSILVSISHYKTVCLLLWFISVDISPWCKMEYSSVYVSGYLKMLEVHRSFSFFFFFRASPVAYEVPRPGIESEPQLWPMPQLQ